MSVFILFLRGFLIQEKKIQICFDVSESSIGSNMCMHLDGFFF